MESGRPGKQRAPVVALFLIGSGLLILGSLSLFLLPGFIAQGKPETEISAVPYPVNYAAAELSLTDLEGNPVKLSDSRGEVVLVNHWATWCPPCRQEMPAMQAFYDEHKDEGFTIIAINQGEPAGIVQRFAQEQELTFPVWLDPAQKALSIFGTDSLPSSYVVDEGGMVRLVWIGAISQEMLEKHVTPLLVD